MNWLILIYFTIAAWAAPIHVEQDSLRDANNNTVTLHGVNWGWWKCIESGDAALIKVSGGNVIRIAFSYSNIITDTGELGGEGLAWLDTLCRWAEEAGIYFILDFHGPPGGCNTATWCEGGANALWHDEELQKKFISTWIELSKRYQDKQYLIAYELMNEPQLPEDYSLNDYKKLCLQLIDGLREVDAERPIIITGPNWGGPESLTDELILPRENLIYTFHFYYPGVLTHYEGGNYIYPGPVPTGTSWLVNSSETDGLAGDNEWTMVERQITAPQDATHGIIMLRSSNNSGVTWFDDVSLEHDGQPVKINTEASFNTGYEGWKIERTTAGELTWEAGAGPDQSGALRISGTDSYNSWVTKAQFPIIAGAEYTLRCAIRTQNSTGINYPCIAWFKSDTEEINRQWLWDKIKPAIDFGKRHNVPIYCGEFGCSQSLPEASGLRWVDDVGQLLNETGIMWTYWNWRESTGMGSMGVWSQEQGVYYQNGPLITHLQELWQPGTD